MIKIEDIIKKSHNGERFSKDELVQMLSYPPGSADSYLLMAEASRISRELTANQAEIHAQFALNLALARATVLFVLLHNGTKFLRKKRELP